MTVNTNDDTEGLSRYKIHARREIVNLLRNVAARNPLVSMQATRGAGSVVTTILDINEPAGTVIVDCAPSRLANERLLESGEVSFETILDNIRILFSAPEVESCMHEDRPALSIAIPSSIIRLQRREFYRVVTPVTAPVKCTIPIADETGNVAMTIAMPLFNISGGGICVVDEKKQINPQFGAEYRNCRLELPGSPVTLTLRLKNAQELTLRNGKNVRRLGFMFVGPSGPVEAAIQRYISKLEREQNARKAGIA